MLKHALSGLLSFSFLFGVHPSLDTIQNYPRSTAKDFYIWHFLQTNISSHKADELFAQTNRVGTKLFKAYAKRSNNKDIKKAVKCLNLSSKQLLRTKDLSCATLSLSPYKASQLNRIERKRLIDKLHKQTPYMARWLKAMNSKQRIENTFAEHPEDFLMLFRRTGQNFRLRNYNKELSYDFVKSLSTLPGFDRFVETVAMDDHLEKLQKVLAVFPASLDVSTHAHFYLALIKIKQDKPLLALNNLSFVAQNDFFQMNRDKALFWSYLITKKVRYLEQLYRSIDLNIYTMYAAEALDQEYIGNYTPYLPRHKEITYDESNPFVWHAILKRDQNITPQQACEELDNYEDHTMQALYAFYLERCGTYAIHPYVTPYLEVLDGLSDRSKALFYAIGRQESRLIAGGISHVFAMGMMQIMPFLSKSIAKKKREKLYLPDMFRPEKNIAYAKYHLKNLQRRLKHPLFIAYAYNGGRGYLRKQLKKGLFSDKRSRYEPFLSMELLSYPETREYGKKVLANYVIYCQLFNEPTSLTHLLRTVTQ